jgi:molybdenum cofactor biosynthesis enzyme MoaA
MNIQSLSIVVPTGKCWNNCPYCVSKQHYEDYGKSVCDKSIPQSYMNRIRFVREEGCNSMIFTGTAEPQQNLQFIYELLNKNKMLPQPFYNISMQTTGTNLSALDIKKLAEAGLTTLALSISSFDDKENWDIIQAPEATRILTLNKLISCAKENNLNVRVCINLISTFNKYEPFNFFNWAIVSNVDQLTFRKIFSNRHYTQQCEWIAAHQCDTRLFNAIKKYVKDNGIAVARLPYGFLQYDVRGISTVIDDDCMAKNNIDEMKYAILRPNNHLYSSWDLKGSLIY